MDTVKWINHDWWRRLRPFTPWYNVGEVWDVTYESLASYMGPDQMYGILNYPLSCRMNDVFRGGTMHVFREYFEQANTALAKQSAQQADMGVFLENHDNPRFSSGRPQYRTALAMTMTWIGVPIVYYGSEQDMDGGNDPDCRKPLWHYGYSQTSVEYLFLQKMNALRAKWDSTDMDMEILMTEDYFLSYRRGDKFLVAVSQSGSQ